MKTSKKILSLFLAAVMVVTTCSVGFTAFAADNKTDVNNAYWNNNIDPDKAFDAVTELVNEYVPLLANGALKSTLEGAGMTVDENTSLQDIIAGVSPALMKTLAGASGNRKNVITDYYTNDLNYEKSDAEYLYNKYSKLGMYDYLEDADATMNFYALYQFCKDNQNSDNSELKKFAKDTLPELKKLLHKHIEAFDKLYESGDDVAGTAELNKYENKITLDLDTCTLYELENFEIDGQKLKNISTEKVATKIAYDNMFLDFEGCPIKIDNIASAIYYQHHQNYVEAMFYLYLANLGGATIKYDDKVLTPSNFKTVIGNRDSFDAGANGDSAHEAFCLDAVYSTIFDNSTLASVIDPLNEFASPYYQEIATGAIELTKSYDTEKYSSATDFINDQKIKDSQIKDFFAFEKNGGKFTQYLTGDSCAFSEYIAKFFKAFLFDNSQANMMIDYNIITCADEDAAVAMFRDLRVADKYDKYGIGGWDIGDEIMLFYLDDTYPSDDSPSFCSIANKMLPSVIIQTLAGKTDPDFGFPGTANVKYFYQDANEGKLVKSLMGNDKYEYDNFAVPESLSLALVNSSINGYIDNFLDPTTDIGGIATGAVSQLLTTNIDLREKLYNIWENLYNQPIETIFNLIPVLVVVLDEVLVPTLLNDASPDQSMYNTLTKVVTLINPYTQESGNTNIGIGNLAFDLNKIVPAILDWLLKDDASAIALVGTYSFDDFKVDTTAFSGKNEFTQSELKAELDAAKLTTLSSKVAALDPEAESFEADLKAVTEEYIFFRDNLTSIPRFTNIFVADKALYGARLNGGLANTLKKKESFQGDKAAYADVIDEAVTEIADFALKAVNDYLAVNKNDPRYNSEGQVAQKGLNNVFVALPEVLDFMGKEYIAKYHVDSDWTLANKIQEKTNPDTHKTQKHNIVLDDFKALATQNDASEVFESFVGVLIGEWINPILDILNDTMSDPDNDISKNLSMVQGILDALGGFGEKSIITDVVNGLFQLKRCDDASFTLTQRDNGFVGFSNESGMFLLSNLFYKDSKGNKKGLIPFVTTLIKKDGGTAKYDVNNAFRNSSAPLLINSAKTAKSAAGTDYDELLSKDNVKAAQELVDTLDTILSSLLENTSVNGFDIDKTDNIIWAVSTTVSGYFGGKNTDDLVKLINNYFYYCVGETTKNPNQDGKIGILPKNGDVDPKKVYTSAQLSNLVIQTYSLIENVIDYVFYDKNGLAKGFLAERDPNMLVADAAYGIISPDAVAMRLSDDYSKTADVLKEKKRDNWNSFKVEITDANKTQGSYTKDYLKFGFANGDKDAFYDAMGEAMNGVAAIIGALLTKSYTDSTRTKNYYSELVYPLFSSVNTALGADGVMTPEAFNSAKDSQRLVKGIITPVSSALSTLYDAPASFVLNFIKGASNLLDDNSLKSLVRGAVDPITNLITGASTVVNNLSPTLAGIVASVNGKINEKVALPEKDIIVSLINSKIGKYLTLPSIDWKKLAAANSPAEVLLLIYGYAVDAVLNSELISGIINSLDPNLTKTLSKLSAAEFLRLASEVLSVVQSPTEVYWTFREYASKLSGKFSYPKGVLASEADNAVDQLDDLVENIFPLLNSLGVTDIESLNGLINDKLYTNETLTTIAKALYGALSGDVASIIVSALGVNPSPQGFAAYLTDKSYGKTYSSAAKTLKKAKSWDKVKTLNWGFKNGSSKAQTGFINGLAAILRPFNDLLSVLLAEGKINPDKLKVEQAIKALALKGSTTYGSGEYGGKVDYSISGGILTVGIRSNAVTGNNKRTTQSIIKVKIIDIVKDINNLSTSDAFGTNGYESAVIPVLEAFMCKNIKTYKQYKKDYKKAKDNLIINVLNPVFTLVKDVANNPFDTVTKILPNVAYFIDSNGLSQVVGNLLAPITAKDGVLGVLQKNGIDPDKIIKQLTGKSLGKIVTDALGIKTKLNIEFNNLAATNLQDILVPVANKLLKDKLGLTLPKFDFATLASHGTLKTVASKARNSKGKFTTKRVTADQGEVLVAVLRYVGDVLVKNAKPIKKLITNIDAIKNNKTIKNIVSSVFNQMATAGKDDIVRAVFYFLTERQTDSFFDYRNFKYKDGYTFSFGNMDEEFCRQLGPMLDGLVGGLLEGGLGGLVESKLYTDDIVAKLATALYGAIEGVNISDSIGSLTNLLAQTGIDFSTSNVASLLTNSKYGLTYPDAASKIKSAGSWSRVSADSLKFGVKDRDSFLNALVAVLRPIYGVVDVLLNDASLNLFNLVKVPGSDGYTSTIVPLLEAFGVYNIKTQYEYRKDCYEAYDNVLLDIINPLWDKVEDILNAPIEMLADILPNLSLFFANDGLLQIVDNLFTPISALLEAIKPIVDVNAILKAAGLNIPKLLKDKVGLNVKKFDLYDLSGTLKPLVGADNVVGTLNSILGKIKIKGTPLGIELPDIDWFKLASHGEFVPNATSQVATYGGRIAVIADQDETLIAVLRFLIDTVNYKGNYDAIVNLITGILGDSVSDSISDVISQVLGMLKGDSDEVIEQLVDLLKQFA
jgi:hypothetical protein